MNRDKYLPVTARDCMLFWEHQIGLEWGVDENTIQKFIEWCHDDNQMQCKNSMICKADNCEHRGLHKPLCDCNMLSSNCPPCVSIKEIVKKNNGGE